MPSTVNRARPGPEGVPPAFTESTGEYSERSGHSALVHDSVLGGWDVPASVHLVAGTATPLSLRTQSRVRVRTHVAEHPDHGFA